MRKPLNDFREHWLDQVLALLWGQWDAVGAAGTVVPSDTTVLDPEAMILLTAGVGRFDPRLFDEALEWMALHERLVNIQRLQTLLDQESFSGARVLPAMAECLASSRTAAKWNRLAKRKPVSRQPEALFMTRDGRPLPVAREPDKTFLRAGLLRDPVTPRRMTRTFDPRPRGNLLLRLRALFGVTSRAEIVAYLATNPGAGTPEIARQTGYLRRTVHNALVEMSQSGFVLAASRGGEKRYRLDTKAWQAIVDDAPPWRNWGALFGAFDHIWQKVRDPRLDDAEPLVLASELNLTVRDVVARLERAGIDADVRPLPLAGDPRNAAQEYLKDLQHIFHLALA